MMTSTLKTHAEKETAVVINWREFQWASTIENEDREVRNGAVLTTII